MSVLERQRSRLKWQQEQLIHQQSVTPFNENVHLDNVFSGFNGQLLVGGAMKPDPSLESELGGGSRSVLSYGNGSEFGICSYAIPRTVSCPPNMVVAAANIAQSPTLSSAAAAARESSTKRKADKTRNLEDTGAEKLPEDKKMKECKEEESKMTEQNSSRSSNKSTTTTAAPSANTKENSKSSENPKPDYIHVRARRGQATDSHSLAERVRREKISERMKFLQDLVPGCNKIAGKAGMLDEIINYVQSLQRQAEFLSMKLAAINNVDNYLVKEMYPASTSSCVPTDATTGYMANHASGPIDTLGQGVPNSSLEMVVNNHLDVTLRRTISAPVSIPRAFLDSSSFDQIQHLTWEDELQNLYSMEY
ncbi:hypothetical protein OROGR_009890 [Orobanche gracilis]